MSRFQCFGHDKGLMKQKSIPNLKSTGSLHICTSSEKSIPHSNQALDPMHQIQ